MAQERRQSMIPDIFLKQQKKEKDVNKRRRSSIKKKRIQTNLSKLKNGVNTIIKNTKKYNANTLESLKKPSDNLGIKAEPKIASNPINFNERNRRNSGQSNISKNSTFSKNPWESLKKKYARKMKRRMLIDGPRSRLQMKMQYFMHPYHANVLIEKKGMKFIDDQSNWAPVAHFILSEKASRFKETMYNFMFPDVRDRILKIDKRRKGTSVMESSCGISSTRSIPPHQAILVSTIQKAVQMNQQEKKLTSR
ncbi:unnamed protein product [Moneuplotes crassus]|uniref:Uncharacterized protein n=1 Tax=Euplotes crassus TaxID=5936 RepID=A0AAD1U7F1_EUPCR|nr:unnamed protein product [Moneuplotes crassus]